jgi:hypothetical protein
MIKKRKGYMGIWKSKTLASAAILLFKMPAHGFRNIRHPPITLPQIAECFTYRRRP